MVSFGNIYMITVISLPNFKDIFLLSRYLAWQQINESKECGDYGEKGQIQITTEDQVRFFFKKFENRKNGTTCDWGQIPEILYKK